MTRVLGHLPCLACPRHPHTPPSLACLHPVPLHWDFSLCTAKLPISTCMITAHSDLYSGESCSTSFGRRKASAPASFMPHYKNGMKSEWSCCLALLSNFLQLSFKRCFLRLFWLRRRVLTLHCELFLLVTVCVAKMGKKYWGRGTLRKVCFVYSIHYPICLLVYFFFQRTIF